MANTTRKPKTGKTNPPRRRRRYRPLTVVGGKVIRDNSPTEGKGEATAKPKTEPKTPDK